MSLPDVGGAILIDLDFLKSKKLVHDKENVSSLTPSRVYTTLMFHTNFLWQITKIITWQDKVAKTIEYMIWKDKDLTRI